MTKKEKKKTGRKATRSDQHQLNFQLTMAAAFALPFFLAIGLSAIQHAANRNDIQNGLNQFFQTEFSRQLETTLDHITQIAPTMAQAQEVSLALSLDNTVKRQSAEHLLAQSQPDIKSVRLIQFNRLVKHSEITPPLSFSQLDVLRKLERGDRVGLELSQKDNTLLHGAPIKDAQDNYIGSILITVDQNRFTQALTPLPESMGYFAIFKRRQKKEIPWYVSGNETLSDQASSKLLDLAGAQWRIKFASAGSLGKSSSPLLFPIIIGTVTGLILAGLVLMLKRAWFVAIERNLQKLSAQFKSKRTQSGKKFKYTLPGFEAAYRNISAIIDSLAQKAAAANAVPAAPSQPSAQTAQAEEQGLLDMDLDLADDDLFESVDGVENDPTPDPGATPAPEAPGGNLAISPGIFRAYDIRGIIGETLNHQVMMLIGRAVGTRCQQAGDRSIVIGRDGRLSSEDLSDALSQGIASTGCDVIDVGMVPTPLVYFAAKNMDTRSAAMITGSHNPPNYNGLKIVIKDQTLYGETIQELFHLIEQEQFAEGAGSIQSADIQNAYLEKVISDVALGRSLKVVVDAGNGVAGPAIVEMIQALGCEVIDLYCDVDGNFPNHHPDPSKPDNLQTLIQTVQEQFADVGLALDGDGDRIGVVTPQGKIIYPDRLLMLYAKDILARNPGGEIIFDIKCTSDLHQLINSLGGRPIMWKTGHSLIKSKLKETGALIAGEMSGHIFFNDRWYGFDDALYSAARLLEILSVEGQDLDELMAELPEKISTPEINIPVTEETKFEIMETLAQTGEFRGNVVTLDGIRVDYSNGWGLVRASNTTPNLVARFEADTDEHLDAIKNEFRSNLLNINPNLGLPF